MIKVPASAKTLKRYSTGLLDCCNDMGITFYSAYCRACARAEFWAQARGEICSCCHCLETLLAFNPTWIRQNIRHARGMPLDVCGDACLYVCCPVYALAQDGRELRALQALPPDPVGPPGVYVVYQPGYPAPPGYGQPPPPGYGPPPGYEQPPPPGYGQPPPGYPRPEAPAPPGGAEPQEGQEFQPS
jgi:Cys-rich protein (TIGR01571 family)